VKKAPLIAGGGNIGTYTALEINALGFKVDIICRDGASIDKPGIKYDIASVNDEMFAKKLPAEDIM